MNHKEQDIKHTDTYINHTATEKWEFALQKRLKQCSPSPVSYTHLIGTGSGESLPKVWLLSEYTIYMYIFRRRRNAEDGSTNGRNSERDGILSGFCWKQDGKGG